MAIVITTAKFVAGAILTAYIATRKVVKTEKGGIVYDFRTNPEVLESILN